MNKPSEIILVAGSARGRAGFTLVEMLVAVGAVLLLSIGIGQVFKQVSKLVGTGSAVAELDQYARSIERQLRDDFAALALTPSDQTFLAIRGRRVGDVNGRGGIGSANSGERNIYLRRDDIDAELRGGVSDSYGTGGRGISPRLDEIMFLVLGGQDGYASSERGKNNEQTLITAPVARVYYGHGLRPAGPVLEDFSTPYDTSRPLNDTLGGPRNIPIRNVLPDGISPSTPYAQQKWGDAFGVENSRNQFAGDFVLLRQQMLLYGGLAAGYAGNNPQDPVIGDSREYAPFIRDLETVTRVFATPLFDISPSDLREPPGIPEVDPQYSQPRLIRHGRTDICGQNPDDVRRWLEGLGPVDSSNPSGVYADATAFDGGLFNEPNLTDPAFVSNQGITTNQVDRPLWSLIRPGENGAAPTAANVLANNLRSLQSAIAGCFSRILAESEPTPIVREEVTSGGQLVSDPADALMDLHATLATRCSNFEVAWSDGTVWRGNNASGSATQPLRVDINSDGTPEHVYNLGDIVWFDYDYPRRMLELAPPIGGGPAYAAAAPGIRPEILSKSSSYHFSDQVGDDTRRERRLNTLPNNNAFVAKYDVNATGGVDTEYLAIWGFREPTSSGTYAGPWVKPRLIRIRMTLHDTQFRIAGGRRYEFIFSIDQN